MQELVDEILRLSDHYGSTPVIVTPRYLKLRPPFFLSLAERLTTSSGRSLRIDWCRPGIRLRDRLADRLVQLEAGRINRLLSGRGNVLGQGRQRSRTGPTANAEAALTARLEVTAMIGRPGGQHRDLIVGLCDERYEMPRWATAISLTMAPALQMRAA